MLNPKEFCSDGETSSTRDYRRGYSVDQGPLPVKHLDQRPQTPTIRVEERCCDLMFVGKVSQKRKN